MTRFKYVYWCISHQQYVEPNARRNLRDQLRCKIVRLNLTFLQQVDFHTFSTWINSQHSSRNHAIRYLPKRKMKESDQSVDELVGASKGSIAL